MAKSSVWQTMQKVYEHHTKLDKSLFEVKFSNLVKQNALEKVKSRFRVTKEYMQKWLNRLQKGKAGSPPIVNKSTASMKKGT